MAKFTAGPFVASVSGSIGGTTFAHNKAGPYTRRRAIPTVSTTSFALAAKSRFATASSGFKLLTAPQRQGWDIFGQANPIQDSLGQSITLTGQQIFAGIRSRQLLAASALIVDPPIVGAPPGLTTMSITTDIGLGTFEIAFTETPLPAGLTLWIEAAKVDSAAINNVNNFTRFLGISAAAQASGFDFQALLETRFGPALVGQTVHAFVSIYSPDTGLVSTPLRARSVVVTT